MVKHAVRPVNLQEPPEHSSHSLLHAVSAHTQTARLPARSELFPDQLDIVLTPPP